MDIRRIASLKDGEQVIGNRTRVKVVKNKLAAPFREAEFDILYGKGIEFAGDVLDLAALHNIVAKSGTWYSYGDDRLGQGRDRVVDLLKENPDLLQKIEQAVRKELGLLAASRPADEPAEAESPRAKGKRAS